MVPKVNFADHLLTIYCSFFNSTKLLTEVSVVMEVQGEGYTLLTEYTLFASWVTGKYTSFA